MKKYIIFFSVLCFIISGIIGCTMISASAAVKQYCDEIINEKLNNMRDADNELLAGLVDVFRINAKSIKYTIEGEYDITNSNKKEVEVIFEYIDLSDAVSDTLKDYLMAGIGKVLLGKGLDTANQEQELLDSLVSNLSNSNGKISKKIVKFVCVKKHLNWIVDEVDDEKIADVISGNLYSTFNNLSNILK